MKMVSRFLLLKEYYNQILFRDGATAVSSIKIKIYNIKKHAYTLKVYTTVCSRILVHIEYK